MADAIEDAYIRGFEAGKAVKAEDTKQEEEFLDLDEHSDVKFALFILGLVGIGFLTWFLCGYIVARHSAKLALTRHGQAVLSIWGIWGGILMGGGIPLAVWSVFTIIKYLAQCISRKRKNRAIQK